MNKMNFSRFLWVAMLFCGALPMAAQAEKFTLNYAAYSGGLQAMGVDLKFDVTPKNYMVDMNAYPEGVLEYLLPWAGVYSVKGTVKKNVFVPQTYDETSNWREDKHQYSFVYKNGALISLKSYVLEDGKRYNEDLKPAKELHQKAVDTLTGVVQMMGQVTADRGCGGQSTVFDGKRRFMLRFADKGTEMLVSSRWNSFSGLAHVCQVEMVPLLGYHGKPKGYYKIQEEARAKGQLPRVWLAQLWPHGPYLPVKMMIKYDYGAMLLHLQKFSH